MDHTKEKSPRRFGIIVGVSDFHPNEHISSIPFATRDAVRVYETLSECSGFHTDQLYLLTGPIPDGFGGRVEVPTRANILNTLSYVAGEATEDDLIFLFIASHGAEISSRPYLLASDTRMNVLKDTAIDTNDVNEKLAASKAKCVIRVFDACRSPFAVARTSAGRMTDGFQEAIFTSAQGWATISSCSSGEYSYESGEFEQGVFSYYLCEGIRGSASNSDGTVTLEGLVEYVKISVRNWCDRQTQKQTPHFQSDLSGITILSSPGPSKEEAPIVAPEHPLAQLQSGIREELEATAEDARRLAFTNEEGHGQFSKLIGECLGRLLSEFNDPVTTITSTPPRENKLQHASHDAWTTFNNEMRALNVQPEFVGHPWADEFAISSSEVVVASSTVVVAAARFSFFYWLWYVQVCDVPQLQKRFRPSPKQHTGVITFKAGAASDERKVEKAVREILSRCAQATVEWTQQLRGFVDERLEPMRKFKSIIE